MITMTDLIALIALAFGCGQLYVTVKAFYVLKQEKRKFPKFSIFALWLGSVFGLILVFLSFDLVFKWI